MANTTESMNDITQQVHNLLELAKTEEWDEQTIADNLAGIECSIDDKLMAYRRYMDKLETAAKLAEAEKKVYAEQAKPYADRAKSLKEERSRLTYPLLALFEKLETKSMKGAYGTFYTIGGKNKLKYDESKLPDRLRRREVRFVPDEEAIEKELIEALKSGETLGFAHYEKEPDKIALRK